MKKITLLHLFCFLTLLMFGLNCNEDDCPEVVIESHVESVGFLIISNRSIYQDIFMILYPHIPEDIEINNTNNNVIKSHVRGILNREEKCNDDHITVVDDGDVFVRDISYSKINHISFYDSQTNFIFKITNSVNNVATTIKSIDFPAKAEGIENRFPYIEIFIDIDDSTFTDSYWGTTNE